MTVFIGSNFTKRKNTWMQIVVGTEDDSFELRILPPTVGIFEGLQEVARFLKAKIDEEDDRDIPTMHEALDYIAASMSNNLDGKIITPKFLDGMGFNLLDMGEYIGEYTEFLSRLADGKN